ncbi:sensor histidine kinase [Pseudorhodoplanes sp.]|uniref:sensor histidine kinase n=1 Tax=Pseudorhodoplanes sp. TaxID=1934341 RepID=UPI003D0DFF78
MEQIDTIPAAIAEVFITDRLGSRPEARTDHLREKLAIQDLANEMAEHPGEVLPRLVKLAMELCEADSAGVSVLDADAKLFRWLGLQGALSAFEGATTPRDHSPCGVCLDQEGAILMERPERVYDWISDANISVPEVLLVPLFIKGGTPLGTLWVVARVGQPFDSGHARILTELATFTGIALRMIQSEEKLRKSLDEQATLTKEMSHRVKNVFAIANGLIRVSARNAASKEQLADSLTGRLQALAEAHALVRRSFSETGKGQHIPLGEIITRILRPYHGDSDIGGPDVRLGEHATNNIALVFHELATNAAKHGALSREGGTVRVRWTQDDHVVIVDWQEIGGPAVSIPDKRGFGSTLVTSTLTSLGAGITHHWDGAGLRVVISAPLAKLQH